MGGTELCPPPAGPAGGASWGSLPGGSRESAAWPGAAGGEGAAPSHAAPGARFGAQEGASAGTHPLPLPARIGSSPPRATQPITVRASAPSRWTRA